MSNEKNDIFAEFEGKIKTLEAENQALRKKLTELQKESDNFRHFAYHDALTGLPNRLLLIDRFNLEIAHSQRRKEELAVMFLDLDGFKEINNTIGHAKGDVFLQSIAREFKKVVREIDTVARVGGDEFVILVPGVQESSDVKKIALRVISLFEESWCIHPDYVIKISVSIGISIYPRDGQNYDSLIEKADKAMYMAKNRGGKLFCFYNSIFTL